MSSELSDLAASGLSAETHFRDSERTGEPVAIRAPDARSFREL